LRCRRERPVTVDGWSYGIAHVSTSMGVHRYQLSHHNISHRIQQ
jgi:hypothetical protein